MLPYCKLTSDQVVDNPSRSYLLGRCAGLVEGVSHMAGLLKAMQTVGDIPHLDPLLCAAVPEQVTIQEVLKVVDGDLLRYGRAQQDRKSTRLNSSHQIISYAVFCLKKKKK